MEFAKIHKRKDLTATLMCMPVNVEQAFRESDWQAGEIRKRAFVLKKDKGMEFSVTAPRNTEIVLVTRLK